MQQLLIAAKYRTAALGQAGDPAIAQTAAEIERLLDMSIAEGRTLTAELSPPTLRAGGLQADLGWLAQRMAGRHGLIVELSLDDGLPPLAEDVRILLFESVRELLFNAVKHAQVQSLAVTVRKVSGREIRVTVSDHGKGFDTTRLKRPSVADGSFGLISIQERLDLLGGSMEIDSAPGRGSRFTLTIHADSERGPEESAPRPGLPAMSPTVRVLLADDHAVVREGLRRLLSQEADIEVVGEATDGKEAADLAAALRPDVILMDLSMPRLDGVEATRAIHRDRPDIRIIGMSMFDDGPHAEEMRAAGAVDYLTKSGSSDKLLAAIRQAVGAPGGRRVRTP